VANFASLRIIDMQPAEAEPQRIYYYHLAWCKKQGWSVLVVQNIGQNPIQLESGEDKYAIVGF